VQVGSEVGRRAKGLGLEVIAYDPYASVEKAAALGARLVTFDEALAVRCAAACVVLCVGGG
jgi:D-3-phosphoglycerate dehydrogenase